jgi:hypothetical protein
MVHVHVCTVWCSVGIDRELNATIVIIITITFSTGNKKYTGGSSDLSHLMASLSSEAYRYTGLLMMTFDDLSVATAE